MSSITFSHHPLHPSNSRINLERTDTDHKIAQAIELNSLPAKAARVLVSRLLDPRDEISNHRQGRVFSFSCMINCFSKRVGEVAFAILFPLNLIFATPLATASIFKKIQRNILLNIESLKNLPLNRVLESSVTIINTIQIAADLNYLANAHYIKDSMQAIAGKIILFIVHAGEGLLWMIRTTGNIRMLTLVSKFNVFLLGASAISHFLFSSDAVYRFLQSENATQRTSLKIGMAKNTAECTLAIGMLISIVNAATIGLLASICIGLELTELIHKEQNANNL